MNSVIIAKHTEKTQEFFNKMRQPSSAVISAIIDVAGILDDNKKV